MSATTVLNIAVDDGSIQVEVAGSGPPIVLLHGWALDRRVWRAQIATLASRHRVVAVDRRGFGQSSAPPDLSREIDDLIVIQRTLQLGRMTLVGMSQAGRVALQFALAYPERVAALVLQGAPLDGFLPEPRGDDAIPIAAYAGLVRDGRIDRMRRLWRAHPLMRTPAPVAADVDSWLDGYEGRDLWRNPTAPLSPIAGDLEAIFAPALVVTGEHDTRWRQLVGDALAYGIPHSRRAVVAGGEHLCNVTHPGAFNQLLAGFVGGIEPMRR
ncbi:MAG: alpha/beta hydrolase [Sphingomonadaceae bacterium]|nr:alpha/beta hydrolase [Sphingomonadaceae bacterium]